jgi:hypothetical protein
VFKLAGHVGPHPFTALVDSGASGPGFISPDFARRCGLSLSPSPNSVQLADGTVIAAAGQVHVPFSLTPTTGAPVPFQSTFTATPLESYDIILGIGWLEHPEVNVNWRGRLVEVRSPGRSSRHLRPIEVIHAGSPDRRELASISVKSLRRSLKRGDITQCYAVFQRPVSADSPSSPAEADRFAVVPLQMRALAQEFADVMPTKLPAVGAAPQQRGSIQHSIKLKPGAVPPAVRGLRPTSALDNEVINEFLKNNCASGRIRESNSPFGAMLLIVKKKDGSPRVCVDYRALNELTVKNRYPLPLVDCLFEQVVGARYFTKFDLMEGFHQIPLAEEDMEKTAFRTRFGSYEYTVLPMGLCNAPSTFMQMMNETFRDLLDKSVLCFLDDILIFSKTEEEHIRHVREVLQRLRQHKLYLKLSKCEWMQDEVEFLGHRLGKAGLAVSPDKISAVRDWPAPRNPKDVRSFLGLAGFYRRFVKDFSGIALPMTELTHEKAEWKWGDEQQRAFAALKAALCSAPVLVLPDPTLPFVLNCDACDYAIGATLQQDHGNGLQPVAFRSKKLSPAERNYDTREKEFMALVDACSHWRHHLHSGVPFKLLTDHDSLKYHKTMPHLSGRLARWVERMAEFDYTIEHIAGVKNVVADALSRRSDLKEPEPPATQQLNAARAARPPPPQQADSPAVAADRQRFRDAAEQVGPRDPELPRPQPSTGAILTPSQRCTANTLAGRHCGQRTCMGQYCWNHLRAELGLRVKPSQVPGAGKGLFAARPLPAGTSIPYTGDLIPLNNARAGGTYVLETRAGEGIDAARRNAGYGRWVNDPQGSAYQANAKFVLFTPPGSRERIGSVRTLRPLAVGEEVLVKYGASYWRYHLPLAKGRARKQAERRMQLASATATPPPLIIVPEQGRPTAPVVPSASVPKAAHDNAGGTPARTATSTPLPRSLAPLTTSRPASALAPRIRQAALADAAYQQLLATPPAGMDAVQGVLFEGNRLLVPDDAALRTAILAECHDAVTGAHFGRDKTTAAVQQRFTWKGLTVDVDKYVASCDSCQRNKPSQQLTPGLLMSLPVPERPCLHWTQDSVTGLPRDSDGYDAFHIFVDRLSKVIRLARSHTTDGAAEWASCLVEHIVSKHGVPESIVGDRDPRITAHYYKELARQIGSHVSLSTSAHAQTDGQSERDIRTVVTAVRAYVNDHQSDWSRYLPLIELAYNSAVNASTGMSPFEVLYGCKPRLPIDVAVESLDSRVPAAADRVARMRQAVDFIRSKLGVAQQRQAVNADRHRRELQFAAGDQVLLSTDGLQFRSGNNKLCSRFVGPFAVTAVVNANAYTLALPPQLQALHPTFNISRLKPYIASDARFASRPQRFDRPPPEAQRDSNGDAEYEVERVVASRRAGRAVQFLVQWKGYPPEENCWMSRAALSGAREAIAEFEASQRAHAAAAALLPPPPVSVPAAPVTPPGLSFLSAALRGLRPLRSGGM